ncbi:MAG: type IV secretion protein Rhs, partial [Rothia mucilaginosa]|nr:type IV secretion protein Rhs [Rothia mucilaginosa]
VGAGWGADPFSLVGGNPVSLVDPWGLSPISFEDYEEYRQERIKNKGAIMAARWLQVAAVAAVVASVFWGGPLIAAIAWGAFAGGLEGMAAGLEKTKNGQIDWGQVILEGLYGAAKGAVTGGVAKVFTHAQVFAKIPVNGFTEKMASKAGSSKFVPSVLQKPAQKAASFISARRDSVSKTSWMTKDPAPWVRMQNISGKYAPEVAGESLSAGVGSVMDYTKKAENFKAEDAAVSFLSGATTGFYKSLITAPVKGKYSAKSEGGQYLYGPVKRTVANDMASRAANASVDWIDKGVQRRLLNDSARNPKPVSERQAERLLAKDFQDAVMGNSKSNFKSLASGYKARRDGANTQSTGVSEQTSGTAESDAGASE